MYVKSVLKLTRSAKVRYTSVQNSNLPPMTSKIKGNLLLILKRTTKQTLYEQIHKTKDISDLGEFIFNHRQKNATRNSFYLLFHMDDLSINIFSPGQNIFPIAAKKRKVVSNAEYHCWWTIGSRSTCSHGLRLTTVDS